MKSSSREGAIGRATDHFDNGDFAAVLSRRVTYRTESQKSDNQVELSRYLDEELMPDFERMGFECEKFDNPVKGNGPILLASRIEQSERPSVLGYGHGDVVLGLDDQWTKGQGPWQLAVEGDRLYGRGTADNKGQHSINMAALDAVIKERGRLGFNARFLIEMGEESGSPGLREILEGHKAAFAADVFIGSDGPRVSPDKPTVTLGARGAINFDLLVHLREGAHHSGNWGGVLADPAIVLAHALASVVSSTGQIRIQDWLPPPASTAVKHSVEGLKIEAGPNAPAIDPGWGEPGLTPAAKVYSWNSFAVLSMLSGHPEQPVNAISPWARAHCQLRYFEGTRTDRIIPALRDHLDTHGFHQVRIVEPPAGNAAGFTASRTEPDHPWVIKVRNSIARTIGEQPAVIPSMGGSICNDLFTDLLGLPAIWIPHSYAGCSQHAPDEHVLLPLCRSALEIMTGIYWDIGEL